MKGGALPAHVALIMDGNGRWAVARGKIRSAGHYAGLERAKEIVGCAARLGVKFVTLYIFSTENWRRARDEVGYLMNLIRSHLKGEFDFYRKNGIRLVHAGDAGGLPPDIQADLRDAAEATKNFSGTTLVMAINYGGRDEIVRAARSLAAGAKEPGEITEESFARALDVPDLPDVDLLIRTGGEKRLSNFLLWHSSYAELVFRDTLWPDYGEKEFIEDIEAFQGRTRKFGAVPEGNTD